MNRQTATPAVEMSSSFGEHGVSDVFPYLIMSERKLPRRKKTIMHGQHLEPSGILWIIFLVPCTAVGKVGT